MLFADGGAVGGPKAAARPASRGSPLPAGEGLLGCAWSDMRASRWEDRFSNPGSSMAAFSQSDRFFFSVTSAVERFHRLSDGV
jgi:hypothetical protein